MNPKWTLLLYGALMLLGSVCGDAAPNPTMSDGEKRRIIRNMLEAQKDIRNALLKIRRQIEGDLNSTGHNGAHVPEDSDEDDFEDDFDDDGMSSEEDEEFFKERQKKIREVRDQLERSVKKIGHSLIVIKELIEKIDKKVDKVIRESHEKTFTANYHFNHKKTSGQHHDSSESSSPTAPVVHQTVVHVPSDIPASYSIGYYKDNFGVFKAEQPSTTTPAEDEPFRPIAAPKRSKKPNRKHRTNRSLDEIIPTVDTDKLSNPGIPSVAGYDGLVQKTVEYQLNQQQIEQ